jgi:hypothetical protein
MALCVQCEEEPAKVRIAYHIVGRPDAAAIIIQDQCYSCAASVVCRMPGLLEPADAEIMHPSIILIHKVNDNRETPEEEHPLRIREGEDRFLDHLCERCHQFQEAFCVSYLDAEDASPTSDMVHKKCFCYYCVAGLFLKMQCGRALPDNHRNAFKDV